MRHLLLFCAVLSLGLSCANGLPRIGPGPREKGGPGGGPPRPGGPPPPFPPFGPPPEYLQEVSEKAREEHLQLLVENEDTPKGQLKGELVKWADKSDIKEEFDKFMADHEQKRKAYHELIAANLAGDALAAFSKIWEITENDQLTPSMECQQISQLLEELKMKVRHLVPLMPPQIVGPAPAGCFPGSRRPGRFGPPHNNNNKDGSEEETNMKKD